jgi:hypothetical protein
MIGRRDEIKEFEVKALKAAREGLNMKSKRG